jgi:diguanylate cyclase (GGDEF)-like protein/PAS domain S-box-containing protein
MSIRQINFLIFILFSIFFYLSVSIFYSKQNINFQDEIKKDIVYVLDDIKYRFEKDRYSLDVDIVNEYLKHKATNRYIKSISISNSKYILYSSDSSKISKLIDKSMIDKIYIDSVDLQEDIYYRSDIKYIKNSSYNREYLLLDFDEEYYEDNNLKRFISTLVLTLLIPIVISFLFWIFTQRFLLKPIKDIEKFIELRKPIDNRFFIDEIEALRVYSKKSLEELESVNKNLVTEVEEKSKHLVYSEKKLRKLVDNINEGVIVLEAIESGVDFIVVDFNKYAQKLENRDKEDVIGKPLSEVLDNISEFGLIDEIKSVYTTEESSHYTVSYSSDSIVSRWRDNYIYKLSTGEIVVIYSDITEQKQYEESLKNLNSKLREKMEIINDNVIISTTDTSGYITDVSEAFCRVSGYSKEELIGYSHNIVRHPDTKNEVFEELWDNITAGKSWSSEIKNKNKNGKAYWVSINVYPSFDKNGEIIGYTSIRQDITDRKKIEKLSITDELTSLYNRRYFNEVLIKEIQRAKRDNNYISLAILDVDNFKKYNDTYGHQMGDDVLEKIGQILTKSLKRAGDYGFRLGGEEFGILFSSLNKDDSESFIDSIREDILKEDIEHIKNFPLKKLTASIGFATFYGDDIPSDKEFYNISDKALYKAKEEGRNRVVSS